MKKELAKSYQPHDFEDRIYSMWNENGCFRADPDPKKKPYTIVIPPPSGRYYPAMSEKYGDWHPAAEHYRTAAYGTCT